MRLPLNDFKSFLIGLVLAALFFVLLGAKAQEQEQVPQHYLVNSYQDVENLERWVNEQIQKGWKPVGGVSISYVKYSDKQWGLHHSQAMVK